MALSTLPYLELVVSVYATIFIGFGILGFVDPAKALSFFEVTYPHAPSKGPLKSDLAAAKKTIDVLAIAYGIRDIYLGVALYAAAFYGTRQALGWIVLAAGCVAAVDGAACRWMVGKGEMNHWGYAPTLVLLGGVILGAFDWVPVEDFFKSG